MDLFLCDYGEGAHPRIMEALLRTNMEQTSGYGMDLHCEHARELIRAACGTPDADVHFLVGGTQANMTVIASILRPYQGVLCAQSGHINVHETGAVEATGHKVLALPMQDGKITAAQVEEAVLAHRADENFEHIVQPGMVYISHPTECGTLYSKDELTQMSRVCHALGIPLFLDGARLGYALASAQNDLTLPEIAALCDVFYIGGTKVGALFGEAVVITNPALQQDFRYMIKQRGGMLAKGRLLGIQFETLFTDGLYMEISRHADELAYRVRDLFRAHGYPMLFESPTNQQFVILPDADYEVLRQTSVGELWQRVDAAYAAWRFCTSWATTEEAVDRLEASLAQLGRHNE